MAVELAHPAVEWQESGRGGTRAWLVITGHLVILIASLAIWAMSLYKVDIRGMNDLGLISVLPPSIFIALGLLSLSFVVSLHRRNERVEILLLHIAVLLLMLYGITSFVEPEPRIQAVWRHAGIIEYVMVHGSVDPRIDAYFNWPGFFVVSAFVAEVSGLRNPISLAIWAPLFFNALYLGPLTMIARSATGDPRLVWLTIWFFYLANWVGQDHFSPQGFSYFLYLVVLGVLLTWFRSPYHGTPSRLTGSSWLALPRRLVAVLMPAEGPSLAAAPWHRGWLVGFIILVFAAIVPSHQLTPFATLITVAALVLFRRCSLRGLPILMVVLVLAWMTYMAVAFLSGHFTSVAHDVGRVTQTLDSNVVGRFAGSSQHVLVVRTRVILTLGVWGLAFLGGLRRVKRGHSDVSLALLAAAPFALLGAQSYGGEMILRVYLFSLPGAAFFAAALFYPHPRVDTSWWTSLVIWLLSCVLVFGFFAARYGNERMDYFSRQEVQAARFLYRVAPPSSLVLMGSYNTPLGFHRYADYLLRPIHIVSNRSGAGRVRDVQQTVREMEQTAKRAARPASYLFISRSQVAETELLEGVPHRWFSRLEAILGDSAGFKQVFSNRDAKIYLFRYRSVR